jgi:hypothetical protein
MGRLPCDVASRPPSLVLAHSHPSLARSTPSFARQLSTWTRTYPACQDMALDNWGIIDLCPKNWLHHTGVTAFHRWKVRQRILTRMHAKDLKTSQTSYSKPGCSPSRQITSRLHLPYIKIIFSQSYTVKLAYLTSYMPSPSSLVDPRMPLFLS